MFRYLVLLLATVALAVAVCFVFESRYHHYLTSGRQLRVDRFTGSVERWDFDTGKWVIHASALRDFGPLPDAKKFADPLDSLLTP